MRIEVPGDLKFLSELYVNDCPDACLLTEYPSSNSTDTIFQNRTEFIIHDPFPPPPRQLLKSLGPHHLMCCWGDRVRVTSEVAPANALVNHWRNLFGDGAEPNWKEFNRSDSFITLFPHESLAAEQQVVDPVVNYRLHSKEIIAQIKCPQAKVFDSIKYPCIVKLSHGYAGLGNFLVTNETEERSMRLELSQHWPKATLVINSVIENIVGDYGIQFYLRRDGTIVWIGLTEQKFNKSKRWCGGTYSNHLQTELLEPFSPTVTATAEVLHQHGYFGLVGIDILRNGAGDCFLVDVNPRLTGITPFLMASRIFSTEQGLTEGIYQASFRFRGSIDDLIDLCERTDGAQVMVLSAVEEAQDGAVSTICHLSVSSTSQLQNREILDRLASNGS